MNKDELTDFINKTIDTKNNSMINLSTPQHYHNNWDSSQLDPSIALTGFPVFQVTDATVNPLTANSNDIPPNGTFRFYVDTTPRFRLWAYLVYQNASGVLIGSWRVISLT